MTIPDDEAYSRGPGKESDLQSLVSNFIQNITGDNERARAALVSTDGVVRSTGKRRETMASTVVFVVTNARVMFIAPDGQMELREWSIHYGELADVTLEREGANEVVVTTLDDAVWRCTLPNANPEVLDAVTRHLRWVGSVRRRVCRLESTTEQVADEIRDHAMEMNWEEAREAYRAARNELDELILDVQLTTPTIDDVLAPELTDIERALEEANVRLFIERSRSQLELGRYLVEHENYDRASEVLERAIALYRQASGQSTAVKRGDAFEFGRQRQLTEDLQRLNWDLEEVAAEPIRQAHEATIRAAETDDPTTAVEYWETAFRRYSRMLELDWWQHAEDAMDDIADIETERERVADSLVEMHADLGHDQWDEAIREHRDSNPAAALEQCNGAENHFERALELAEEFHHEQVDELADHLQSVEQLATDINENRNRLHRDRGSPRSTADSTDSPDSERNTGGPSGAETDTESESESSGDEEATTHSETSGDDDSATSDQTSLSELTTVRLTGETFVDEHDARDWIPPSMSDIADIETHHELTFDLDEIGLPSDVADEREASGDDSGTN